MSFLYIYCSVQVKQWQSQGEGRRKKAAKRIAAENMLSMIEETKKVRLNDSSMDETASPSFLIFSPVSMYQLGGGRGGGLGIVKAADTLLF